MTQARRTLLSKVMKRAWEFVKRGRMLITLALKKAWAVVRQEVAKAEAIEAQALANKLEDEATGTLYYYATGNTYARRGDIKFWGGKWDAGKKLWIWEEKPSDKVYGNLHIYGVHIVRKTKED